MKNLPEGAGSPISRMPQQQKAGYGQYTSPFPCLVACRFFSLSGRDDFIDATRLLADCVAFRLRKITLGAEVRLASVVIFPADFTVLGSIVRVSVNDNLYSKLHVNQPCKATLQSNKTGSEKLNVVISKRDAQGNLRRLRKRM